ncbi:hypothetical protein EDC39_107171 [Geothermobacter ehrlichii]|uniref:Uncharacterized protein n=1 Tax=Geothermobacter ehrlichii TaxID=213224 RepID=A0A5D3WKE7_9BACT|nr:hypothetical protein [Geothermobacter ehrlichii]TYO98370.1 hypothetical protein EDC39_107171 [Geothermobacter ehrlichii]
MYLNVCSHCVHGSEKDGHSHCGREAVYSYLSNCIQKKALRYYLEREAEAHSGEVGKVVSF